MGAHAWIWDLVWVHFRNYSSTAGCCTLPWIVHSPRSCSYSWASLSKLRLQVPQASLRLPYSFKKSLDGTICKPCAVHKAEVPALMRFLFWGVGRGNIMVNCSPVRPVLCLADPSVCLDESCSLWVRQARKTLLSWTARKKNRWTYVVLASSLADLQLQLTLASE